jgi:hypothetical protein
MKFGAVMHTNCKSAFWYLTFNRQFVLQFVLVERLEPYHFPQGHKNTLHKIFKISDLFEPQGKYYRNFPHNQPMVDFPYISRYAIVIQRKNS